MQAFRPTTTAFVSVILLVTGLWSCAEDDWLGIGRNPEPPRPTGQHNRAADGLAEFAGETTTESGRPIVVQGVRFQVLRVRAPAGTFSRSEKIWNALNEDVLPMDRRALLVKNGLRVAAASQDVWPQVKAVLDSESVEVFTDQRAVHDGYPLPLLINTQPLEQTLFMIRPDDTMAGARFPQSTMGLRLAYSVPLDAPQSIRLEIMPEVRLPSHRPAPTVSEFGWTEHHTVEQSRPLWELACEVTAGPDQFVVVGPSPSAGTPHLAGTLLLFEQIQGREYESICFITPTLLRVGAGDTTSGP